MTVGGKGGTGKTTALAAIADYLILSGCKVGLYDGDPKNSGPGSFYSAYQRLSDGAPILLDPESISKVDGLDRPVYDLLENGLECALVDLGAGDDTYLIPWVLEGSTVLAEENINIFVLSSITKMESSVYSFFSVLEELGSHANYIVGLNSGFCSDFTHFTQNDAFIAACSQYNISKFVVTDRFVVGKYFDQLGDTPALIMHPELATGDCPHNFHDRREFLNYNRVKVILKRQQDEIASSLSHLFGGVSQLS
jgi:hypothetical protein